MQKLENTALIQRQQRVGVCWELGLWEEYPKLFTQATEGRKWM